MPVETKNSLIMHGFGVFSAFTMICVLLYLIYSYQCSVFVTQYVSVDPYHRHFNAYLKKFGKSYEGNEVYTRMAHFKHSLKEIHIMNEELKDTNETAYGLTKFSDMSQREFEKQMLLAPGQISHSHTDVIDRPCFFAVGGTHKVEELSSISEDIETFLYSRRSKDDLYKDKELPRSVDWRSEHIIGPILDQGACGSCWAFGVVEVMESMLRKETDKKDTRLSIQVKECAGNAYPCRYGDPEQSLRTICNKMMPITTESDYPLEKGYKQFCRKRPHSGATLQKYSVRYDMNVEDILRHVAFHGPVIAAVNSKTWKNYIGSGILRWRCDGAFEELNHVVQIVGYDRSGPLPYFIVRNSWGTDYGNKGYMQVAITDDFFCGIGRQISYMDVGWKD